MADGLTGLTVYLHLSLAHPPHAQRTDPSLINPPYCAWRFVGNHDAWNVAFPDMRSMYHVMQMNMGMSVRPSLRRCVCV